MKHGKTEIDDSELIEFARGELLNGELNEATWQKALALSGQMEANAKEKYLLLRVAQLRRNMDLEAKYAKRQVVEKRKESTLHQLSDHGLENSVLNAKDDKPSPERKKRTHLALMMFLMVAALAVTIGTKSYFWEDAAFKSAMDSLIHEDNASLPIGTLFHVEKDDANDSADEQDRWRLTVITRPKEAKVQILNIRPPYSEGMRLAAGKYHIKVSKKGYDSKTSWFVLDRDLNQTVTLDANRFALTIETSPSDARVQILNIKEVYRDGIDLPKGTYTIRVSKRGYQSLTKRISVTSDIVYKAKMFTLQKEKKLASFISDYRLPFSEAFPGCLDKDMRLPSVSELVEIIAADKITEHKEAWFWTAERSDAISYNIVQNVPESVVRNARLSERHYFYCIR